MSRRSIPRRSFLPELTEFANAIRHNAATGPRSLSVAKDVPALMEKQRAKLARRAARAGHKGNADVR